MYVSEYGVQVSRGNTFYSRYGSIAQQNNGQAPLTRYYSTPLVADQSAYPYTKGSNRIKAFTSKQKP